MLYTSGSTGKPKGVAHSTGGYLLYAALTTKLTFDLRAGDVYACMADCGWITGHTYIVYGPLANGATTLMFESTPLYPDASRYWDVVQTHRVTQFYTAPTAIRALMKYGDAPVKKHDLSSLRVLGSVGEPINPEAWRWYAGVVGGGRCAVVDTFWQTETGGHVITPLPGATPAKPGAASLPFFGIDVAIMGKDGVELAGNDVAGVVCVRRPWPGLARTIHGDHARYLETYMRPFPGFYFTGDGGVRDRDGYIWITGRVDDVLNVSGHRLGSAELESALVLHAKVAEAAVIGFPHDTKGEGICCYVTLKDGIEETPAVAAELRAQVRKVIGPFATPDLVILTSGLPKTRSGKIMRRVLRKIVAQQTDQLGDISTLADTGVVHELIRKVEAALGVKLPPLA
jgi:acetyl-CoA synthetase